MTTFDPTVLSNAVVTQQIVRGDERFEVWAVDAEEQDAKGDRVLVARFNYSGVDGREFAGALANHVANIINSGKGI